MEKPYDAHITRLDAEERLLQGELAAVTSPEGKAALVASLKSVQRSLRWYKARNTVRDILNPPQNELQPA